MSSTTAITSLGTTCQSGMLNESPFETSDELMLEELERRDGIYSFIFHELESPKVTKNTEPEIIANQSLNGRNVRRNSITSKAYLKKLELSQQLDTAVTTKATTATITTTSPKTISSLTNIPGEVNAPVSSTSTSSVTSALRESTSKFPTQNELFRYQQYLKTWYPPPPTPPAVSSRQLNFMKASPTSIGIGTGTGGIGGVGSPPFYLNKRQTNLYVCMMNCGVSVRPQPPRFSHITEPLVRNRRHALKESEEYKQQNNLHALQAPDLRALFPYDPDVHAPFLTGRNGTLGCLKAENDIKSDENKLLVTCNEIK